MPRKKQYQWQAQDDGQGQDFEQPSRSAKKRESHALQALGEELARLAPQEVQDLNLSADLTEALALYARIRNHEGRRRQMQFIGRLIREMDDVDPLRDALERRKAGSMAATAALHRAEQWRDRLLSAPADELDQLLDALPRPQAENPADPDSAQPAPAGQNPRKGQATGEDLRSLVLKARKEMADGSAPHARRAVFRAVHKLLVASGAGNSEQSA
ncbi:ribosome biogenesis factor YjgA [Desulfovibrio sp.]|uniref:ribosome biogenesis factor YjgA n=1 Tax=Desulfovibrio sp. TaxID=885 RepID=UPI0025B8BF0B|nr:ribosome biogenesis factor YjgA [Desulfovibrio sp.]